MGWLHFLALGLSLWYLAQVGSQVKKNLALIKLRSSFSHSFLRQKCLYLAICDKKLALFIKENFFTLLRSLKSCLGWVDQKSLRLGFDPTHPYFLWLQLIVLVTPNVFGVSWLVSWLMKQKIDTYAWISNLSFLWVTKRLNIFA